MAEKKKGKRKLTVGDFCGDGEPYSEVEVRISIRVLGAGITRSRLAVTVYPDPALEKMAKESLRKMKIDSYGRKEDGTFGACLSENFNGWEDLDEDYPRMDEKGGEVRDTECLKAMNAYVQKSVDWALALNKRGMEEAAVNAGSQPAPGGELVM
jgi:hypothetical protein